MNKKSIITKFCLICLLAVPVNLFAATVYQENWNSVGKHVAAPEWFKDAKFGIYFHWGAFTVPAFGTEWYPRDMYNRGSWEYNNHVSKYGDPFGDWQYHNFILGKNDKNGVWTQFAPKLKSEGGKFDPDEWAALFEAAGAKFAGPVAEHHDGFSMWNSKVNEWNSVSKGPKLDLAGLFAKAFRAKNMKFIMTTHHAWNFDGYWKYPPVTQTVDSLKKLYGQLPLAVEHQLWFDKLKEIIDQYQPDLIWHDLYLNSIPESFRLKFLAYYYNKSVDWNKDVVVTSKDGFRNGELPDYERGGPADVTPGYWLTDDAISRSSWSYTEGMKYYSQTELLHSLIDRVSKNGNLMLNISPMADGSIPEGQRSALLAIGDWLKRFGSSIYCTRAWSVFGQGPTKMGGGAFTGPVAGNGRDVRFTRAKDSSAVYAIFLGWPGDGAVVSLNGYKSSLLKLPADAKVELMGATPGTDVELKFNQDQNGLNVTFPSKAPYNALAYPVRIQLKESTLGSSCSVGSSKPEEREPYGDMATIPGKIEFENYDKGGEGVAYHDEDFGNQESVYRKDDVDITGDSVSGFKVGYTASGEWLEYTVNVAADGEYDWIARVSTGSDSSAFQLFLDGDALFASLTLPNTGGWDTYVDLKGTTSSIKAGKHVLRVSIDQPFINLDYIQFDKKVPTGLSPSMRLNKTSKWAVFDAQGRNLGTFSADSKIPRRDAIRVRIAP